MNFWSSFAAECLHFLIWLNPLEKERKSSNPASSRHYSGSWNSWRKTVKIFVEILSCPILRSYLNLHHWTMLNIFWIFVRGFSYRFKTWELLTILSPVKEVRSVSQNRTETVSKNQTIRIWISYLNSNL